MFFMKRLDLINKNGFKYVDKFLIFIILAILVYGIVAITAATANPLTGDEQGIMDMLGSLDFEYTSKQVMFLILGVALAFVVCLIDYNNLRHYTKWLYWICIVLLVAVLAFGSSQRGTTGWFMIGSFGFQPSEFCKIALIITFSKIIADYTEGSEEGITKFSQLWPLLWRFAIPFALVAAQPDMGTALVFIAIFIGILFVAKATLKIFAILFGIAGGMVPVLWLVLEDWQKNRLFSFFNSEYASSDDLYQSTQAKLAIGSGQLTGKGMFSSDNLSQLGYLPEQQNDFIFSATTESFGFIGATILIILYALLIIRIIMLAMRAKDDFGTYICVGTAAMILFHVFENIGMNIGIMPITGISLPFFSYGGSNLLVAMILAGLVINVDMRRTRWNV